MNKRIAAVLSASTLTLATCPVKAEGRIYNWTMALKNGDLQLIRDHDSYSLCTQNATWMRNNLNLKGGISTAFCAQWNQSSRYSSSGLYITGPESNIFYYYVRGTMSNCRNLGKKIVTQLRNRTKFKTWTAKCRFIYSDEAGRRKGE